MISIPSSLKGEMEESSQTSGASTRHQLDSRLRSQLKPLACTPNVSAC